MKALHSAGRNADRNADRNAGQVTELSAAQAPARAQAGSHRAPPGSIVRCSRAGLEVNCGRGILTLQELQLPGGRPLPATEILRGRPELFGAHTIFDAAPASVGAQHDKP